MHRPNLKSPDDPLVDDAAEAMRKTITATCGAMAVPKAKIDAAMAKEKSGNGKRRK